MSSDSHTSGTQGGARYRFGELIATGGMGEVWRATDTALDRTVAIKLLKPEYAEDPVNRARFDSEAQHAAALHHPHIAAVYDVGEMPTASGLLRPYMVMEYVDGQPLSAIIEGSAGGLAPDLVRDLLSQAADGIAAAHQAGIIHRDLKPANLLITRDDQVKVTDFGIARAATSSAITGTGQVMGTPQYLSPEQARGDAATPASDVYSLGIVAYEALTGRRPFQKETPVATAIAQIYDPVPPLPATIPADLAAIVMKALAKDPAERYPDAAAFGEALRGSAGTPSTPPRGTHASTLSGAHSAADDATLVATGPMGLPPIPAAATPASGTTTPAEDDDPDEKAPTNWLLYILLGVAGVLVIAVIATAIWVFNGSSPSDDEPAPTTSASDSPSASATTSSSAEAIVIYASDYVGKDINDVLNALKGLGLDPREFEIGNDGSHKEGEVAEITPTDGLTEGSFVTVRYYGEVQKITLSSSLIGQNVDTVVAQITSQNIGTTKTQVTNDGTHEAYTVSAISPMSGLTPFKDTVTVSFYGPQPTYTVPSFTAGTTTLSSYQSALTAASLTYAAGSAQSNDDGNCGTLGTPDTVVSVSPGAGTSVAKNSTVTVNYWGAAPTTYTAATPTDPTKHTGDSCS